MFSVFAGSPEYETIASRGFNVVFASHRVVSKWGIGHLTAVQISPELRHESEKIGAFQGLGDDPRVELGISTCMQKCSSVLAKNSQLE